MAAIKRGFIIPSGLGISANDLYLTGTFDATNNSGTLNVAGGASIGKSLAINGSVIIYNGPYYSAIKSSATASTLYTLPPTSPATGTSVLQSDASGILSWVPMVASGTASGFIGIGSTTVGLGTTI